MRKPQQEMVNKMQYRKIIMITCSFFFFTGCQYFRPVENEVIHSMVSSDKDKTILLLPPIGYKVNDKLRDNVGRNMAIRLAKKGLGNVIYANDIRNLKDMLNTSNLMRNGEIDKKEIHKMAQIVGADSVISCRILVINHYPPQRISTKLIWIDLMGKKEHDRAIVDIDMNNANVRNLYEKFIGDSMVTKIYGEITFPQEDFQTARLSNERFQEFVGSYLADVFVKIYK